MAVLIIGFLYNFITAIVHPFHVSVCEIYHNEKANSLEISLKLFIDDLEVSIQKSSGSDFKLIDVAPAQIEKTRIENYLSEHFKIKLDSEPVKLTLLGFEFRDDSILCYLEGGKVKVVNELELTNSLITEVYADQINLTHLQIKGNMKSLKTSKENAVASVDFTAL